jgi:hypothetical protein
MLGHGFARWMALCALALFVAAGTAWALIGGKSAADGPFLIDDMEDLNLRSESLGRNWVSDFVGTQQVLSALTLSGAGLTLAAGQSPTGAFLATVPARNSYVSGGFGIPMPAMVGESTLTYPGDITSFATLEFFACHEPSGLTAQKFQVLMECYPQNGDGSYPKVAWNFTPASGLTFEKIVINLASPSGIVDNPSSRAASELLTKTRYLYFLHYAGPVTNQTTLRVRYDDIRLVGPTTPPTTASGTVWVFYP